MPSIRFCTLKRNLLVLTVVVMFLGAPAARAATIADLQARVEELKALLATLQAQQGASPSQSLSFARDLTLGSSGSDVTRLQEFLLTSGYAIPAGLTGYFGEQTRAALIQYQLAYGIAPAVGYFGPITRARIVGSNGTTSALVSLVQTGGGVQDYSMGPSQGQSLGVSEPVESRDNPRRSGGGGGGSGVGRDEETPSSEPPRVVWERSATTTAENGRVVLSYLDIPYATDDPLQALDIYRPADATAPLPVIVFIHGGWFEKGDKRADGDVSFVDLAAQGYAVASINYRLFNPKTGENQLPVQVYDSKGAIRFLRVEASAFGLDPEKIGVMGYSAGAFLASLLGTSGDVSELEGDVGGNLAYADSVEATVVVAGAFSPSTMSGFNADQQKRLGRLVGCDFETPECQLIFSEGAPEAYADALDPPFLILHGAIDPTVPVSGAYALDAALTEAGVDSTLVVAPQVGHQKRQLFPLFENSIRDFFAQHLQ